MPPAPNPLRIGTRGSRLALAQTEIAVAALRALGTEVSCEVVTIATTGDRVTDRPFEAVGPKGIFVREIQRALREGEIDAAVHSLKDLEATEPDGLVLAAILEREDARDVLVSRTGLSLEALPSGARVGTSSSRRRAQLAVARPDREAAGLRGNVDTRLAKVERGEVDAAVLAGAGLRRLGRADAITQWLGPRDFVPSPGQGAIALEVRASSLEGDLAWVRDADHLPTRAAVEAERTFMRAMEGGCELPLGAWARSDGDALVLDGFVATTDGARHVAGSLRGTDPVALGETLAERLLEQGGADIVAALRRG